MNFNIRAATKEDCKDISRMILELALYEKMTDQVKISCKGFTIVGYGLCFYTYSTWKGRAMHLEDLYVMPEFRGIGIGKCLMSTVAKVAKENHCARLQLNVLEWNTPSRDFYATRGAQDLTVQEGWHLIRFDGQSLDDLGNDGPKN
ncbi:thialysine N-epsilon-acetyltransferase-like isoform 3-T3 [Syngnathus typhle]